MQTVLEGLGLVENKTAQQDAAALKEVDLIGFFVLHEQTRRPAS